MTLLDGGMGQELLARSGAPPTALWATRIMMDRPDLVRGVHADYFAAGAEIATANTYAVHRDRLVPHGVEDRFESLHLTALRLAREARDAHGSGRVAGALGPLMWSYTAKGAPPAPEAARLYAEICEIQAPHVDLWIAETIASLDQARGVLMGAMGRGIPVWLAVTVDDADGTRLRDGDPVSGLLDLAAEFRPDALLLNCSSPEAITTGLAALADAPTPIGAYANGFVEIVPAFLRKGSTLKELRAREDLSPAAYADHAADWIALGATIIGGCCEVGPAHIAELSRRFTRAAA